jgi:hypothetical protein
MAVTSVKVYAADSKKEARTNATGQSEAEGLAWCYLRSRDCAAEMCALPTRYAARGAAAAPLPGHTQISVT